MRWSALLLVCAACTRLNPEFDGATGGSTSMGSSGGCLDGDADAVCDDDDNCPDVANPDQADGDDDGLGDACSPCGTPPTFPMTVGPSSELSIGKASFASGGTFAYVAPGASFTVSFSWQANFCECPGCVTQGMIGITDQLPGQCFYDRGSDANCKDWHDQATLTFVAPTEPGLYTLRAARTWEYGCEPGKFQGDPALEFAAICVH